MAMTKTTQCIITVLPDGQLQCLTKTTFDDGEGVTAVSNHRHVVVPGQDTSSEDQLVKDVAYGLHTQARIDAYNDAKIV